MSISRCPGGEYTPWNGKAIKLDLHTMKSENFSLTFYEISSQNLPSPPWEGMKGRGDQTVSHLSTPTLALPHRRRRGIYREISNMFG
jgi:hypothetical protein